MLRFEKITLRAAARPEESLLPDVKDGSSLPFFHLEESVDENDLPYLSCGMVPSVLPYRMQNLYSREICERDFTAAILENDRLRATFLPELGGRLWSLYDKCLARELLYVNDSVKYANLALRNAWFAGGVEWNIGIKGHSPLTCDPLFTAREVNKDGGEVLKMWEFEPIRHLAYVIRATLAGDELAVQISAENTKNEESFMYWWSNIAVPQNKETRVFVPCDTSFVTSYRDGGYVVGKKSIPYCDGHEMSRPADAPIARDYFFDIPDNANKWIASVEGDGIGLLHRSSDRLIGRKMFVWGSTPGGNHWNNWLTDGRDYYEIQAGLAKTQFQHFPIGAREIITWQEGYRALRIDDVNGDFRAICTNIDAAVSPCDWGSAFEIVHEDAPVLLGSGRGRLAELLCPDERSSICSFPDESLGEDEAYFTALLGGEAFTGDTSGYASDARWLEIIEAKPDKSDLDNLQAGVLYLANNQPDEALRRLAAVGGKHRWLAAAAQAMVLSTLLHDDAAAMPFIREAMRLRPDYEPLAVLYGELCIRAGRFDEFVQYYQTDRRFAGVGRVRMYAAKCLAEVDALDEAAAILDESLVVPDIREGEYAISRIWVELYKKIIARDERRESAEISEAEVFLKHPLPVSLDFRMH